jgi:hypothetical protein
MLGGAALVAAVTLAAAGFAAAAETMIPQDELEAALKGKTFKDDDGNGNVGTLTYGADMTLRFEGNTGPLAGGDSGTYRFAEGGYCSKWTKLRKGDEWCFTASRRADGFQLWTKDGKKGDTLTNQ